MPNTVNITQINTSFAEALGKVDFSKEAITVEKQGKPYAVIISPEEFKRYKRIAQQAFLATVKDIHASNTNVNDQELTQELEKLVDEVREVS